MSSVTMTYLKCPNCRSEAKRSDVLLQVWRVALRKALQRGTKRPGRRKAVTQQTFKSIFIIQISFFEL